MDKFRHILHLTDDTGILEHALGQIPRRKEGYSTDDQARALWMCLEWLDLASDDAEIRTLERLIDIYMSFLLWVQQDNGHFHNNIAYDRTKEAEQPSDDCLGRCLWASALAYVRLQDKERRAAADSILTRALTQLQHLRSPRGWAYALAALSLLIRNRVPRDFRDEVRMLARKLIDSYRKHADRQWKWFEPIVAYSNGLLPWGLLCAYEAIRDRQALDTAIESLDFLIDLSMNEQGQIRPVGNRGWCTRESRALWDQQPVDVLKLCLAASKAADITGEGRYEEIAVRCREWFYGANDAGISMVSAEGGCYDGIGETGVNLNQGAEAAISYLITEALYQKRKARNAVII